uniref:Retrovirus-related Pol polyprotein from transposon TNT 1-94 n=1 Tax=Tanacetum cinerariifolium TaxID=118510 RepID=A0A699H1D0_TANCI|nr:retrovirus-related Pol polyprotein from transposon TNT 1-94 [Tanacetum cinerariifolium]
MEQPNVIEFGDSYEAPQDDSGTGSASESSAKKKGRTVAVTTEDMQKRRNDVKARTTLLLALPDEHQLRFSKYKTAQELWAAILKTFGGNEATKKTKKNQLKQQYGNFKEEGSETLENRSDLDTMSLDDLYNHLKLYEPEVQKKSESNSQNMAFISLAKNNSGMGKLTLLVFQLPALKFPLIKYVEINQIDKDDTEEIDIKWNMALLSMRANRFWKNTKEKYYHTRAPRSQDRGRREIYKQGSKEEEQAPKALMAIDRKDMSWTGLPEFADDTITNYSRPSPSIESNSNDLQSRNSSVSENGESSSSILSKPVIKFVKAANSPTNIIDDKGYWDSGCSRYMTGNISYLFDYEPYDGGYVSFGQGGGNFTRKECIVLGRNFKLKDDTNVLLRTPREHNMRLGHLNFKTMNKLLRHNLAKGLPSKCFENDHTYVACLKGKQHKASCKTKLVHSVTKPLQTLHMDLFRPTSISNLNHKWYCLVLTDDFSRFTWTFFLQTKDETSDILRNFITKIENLKDVKVKIIRCDNGGEFRNKEMNDFCLMKGIKKEFSNAKTPQQNEVAERRNRTLIEAAITMLADAMLPVTFWAEAVNTACYVQNRVLVNKSQTKTSNDLFNGRTHAIEFLKPFGCHVMILNTLHYLGKFDAKGDEGTSSTNFSGIKDTASQDVKKDVSSLRYIALLNCFHEAHLESSTSNAQDACNDNAPESIDTNGVEADLGNIENNILATLTLTFIIHTDHPKIQIIGPVDTLVQTRNKSKEMEEQSFIASIHYKTNPDLLKFCLFSCFLSQEEPKKISDALKDLRVRPIGTKWVLKNKKDERGIVIKNKARLVAQGHTQEEGIDYEEVFTPVARIEAIRLFLAYASFIGFTVYQMDVKSAFLYGTIDEEAYVMQPLRFQDPEFLARVYKVEKAMYGLHQAPRAWYGTLSKYLLTNSFQKGTIDQTLFIRKHRGDFLLVQVYVHDIILESSNLLLCREFEALMHEKFQMSAMGELNFFLGLQVLQKKDDIFLSQDKYVGDILKKVGYSDVRSANTPMDKENP